MKILWFTWKDKKNPLAGGAEVVNEELAKRLVDDGHEVTFLVGGFKGGSAEETKNGFKIIRVGNKWSVYFKACQYYKKNLRNWPDFVIDEVNTIPFFAKFYVGQKNILFVHQLCRQIWFYQMFFPLNIIGYLLEPIYLWLLRDRKVITISESTKKDLMRFGFKEKNISIISEGIELETIKDLSLIKKFDKPTILSLGTVRSMKRTKHILKAFEILKKDIPEARLVIAGKADGAYGDRFVYDVENSQYSSSIRFIGPVSKEEKVELMQKSHIIAVTSVKEGWGLIVTEANSQGTPAVVYNVDGLRDAVKNNETGIVCEKNTPENMAENIVHLLNNKEQYKTLQKNAWEWSKEINFEKSYKFFIDIIKKI
jgi:glycosyltransferase involved in cell wall biosynthesis